LIIFEKLMIRRAAAIVIKDGKILLMRRQKPGQEYYTIPGGHIEEGEDSRTAAARELKEETNMVVETGELFLEIKKDGWHNYFYLAKNARGEARFGGEELKRNSKKNLYELQWIELSKLPKTNLLPDEVKKKLLEKYSLTA
jgi:ADP-ribose pyrophosphatase YjhB (NUDIX family)